MAPYRSDVDFKALFRRLASAGAGRPVDMNGFPEGPWTPELLADSISQIAENRSGIELRTVQLWFQANDKGIGPDNIRWLARVFGCDDPEATSAWQAELSASQSHLTAMRRKKRRATSSPSASELGPTIATARDDAAPAASSRPVNQTSQGLGGWFSLPKISEAFFGSRSTLNLPASVFAGAVALGFLSYFLNIHSVTYVREDGITKQVGFLWAPNWTFLFMIFLPLFFLFVLELVVFWRREGRNNVLNEGTREIEAGEWMHKVEASVCTFWVVLVICIGFAGVFQWISVRLIPLLRDESQFAIDWGSIAIAHPEILSVPQAIAFSGFAYLYMCVCFYLYFAGLILLFTLVHDCWEIGQPSAFVDGNVQPEVAVVRNLIMQGLFRCTVSGLLVAICMKLQSLYLTTDAGSILEWLVQDASSVLFQYGEATERTSHPTPTHYTSLLVAMATLVVFLYGLVRIGQSSRLRSSYALMPAAVALLGLAYLSIGSFAGFSLLLGATIVVAIYGLFDPAYRMSATGEEGRDRSVS